MILEKYKLCLYRQSFSFVGLVGAVLFFSVSLSPSLLPRPIYLQGVLSGLCLVLGYGFGALLHSLWGYLQLPQIRGNTRLILQVVTGISSAIVFFSSLYYLEYWQNDLRRSMSLPPADELSLVSLAIIALVVALVLMGLVKFSVYGFRFLSKKLKLFLPPRVSNLLGLLLFGFLVFSVTNDYIAVKVVFFMDEVYALADASTDQGIKPPNQSQASGSERSLVRWDELGRQGQNFVTTGPSEKTLSSFFGSSRMRPLRVYVGLRSRESVEERAKLALDELIRIDGFSRSKLIIATPTGTGWLDPSAMDTLEYLHGGDTATVAMQYSYLPSWLTLLVDPSAARRSASVLYDTVHQYWSKLPKENRPELYLFGLSLGALATETSVNVATIINNPIQGAVLAGAPFPSPLSPRLMQLRQSDSPVWLPVIQDASMVRFTAQQNRLREDNNWEWGPVRFVYIQYASDPMVFFSLDLIHKEPEWLRGERGHDVSSYLRWYPVITFLQLLFDLPMADKVPRGNAHHYSASSYIDAWLEVTQPNLAEDDVLRIRDYFNQR